MERFTVRQYVQPLKFELCVLMDIVCHEQRTETLKLR